MKAKMVKCRVLALALASAGFIAASAVANASPISDVIDPTDITLTVGSTPTCPAGFVCGTSSISLVHNIIDNGFNVGDTINSATLKVFLTDRGGAEVIQIILSSGQTITDLNMGSSITETAVLTPASIAALRANGSIGVTVEVQQQGGPASNFVFDRSELSVDFTKALSIGALPLTADPSAVSEPFGLALLGLGLAGLGWSRRKN